MLQSMGSQRVEHDFVTEQQQNINLHEIKEKRAWEFFKENE